MTEPQPKNSVRVLLINSKRIQHVLLLCWCATVPRVINALLVCRSPTGYQYSTVLQLSPGLSILRWCQCSAGVQESPGLSMPCWCAGVPLVINALLVYRSPLGYQCSAGVQESPGLSSLCWCAGVPGLSMLCWCAGVPRVINALLVCMSSPGYQWCAGVPRVINALLVCRSPPDYQCSAGVQESPWLSMLCWCAGIPRVPGRVPCWRAAGAGAGHVRHRHAGVWSREEDLGGNTAQICGVSNNT